MGAKTCNKCGTAKDFKEFAPDARNCDGRQGRCRACQRRLYGYVAGRRQTDSQKKTYNTAWRKRTPRHALSVSLRSALRRRVTIDPITVDCLMEMWRDQQGKCALSGVQMTWAGGTGTSEPTSISLDRVDRTKGYDKGNVRLLCHAINDMRGAGTDDSVLTLALGVVLTAGYTVVRKLGR